MMILREDQKSDNVYNFERLNHADILQTFIDVVNIIQPKHPYFTRSELYPVSFDEIQYHYRKNDMIAGCKPKPQKDIPILFSANKKIYNSASPEKILSVNVHEATHVTVGSHSNKEHGTHTPEFWRKMGFNTHKILDEWHNIKPKYNISKEEFIGDIVNNDINSENLDQRYTSVIDQRHEFAKWFKNTLQNTQ